MWMINIMYVPMHKICSTKLYFLIKPVKTEHAIFPTSVACNSIINQAQDNNVSSVVEFQRLEVCMYLKTKIFEKKCHNLEFRIKNGLCLMIFGKIGILLQNCSDLLCEKIVLVIKKNFWNLRLKTENFKNFWDH